MTAIQREVRAERLLGRKVRDVDGVVVGRIEEFLVEWIDSEPAVTEFHIGQAAWLERVGGFVLQLPFFSALRPIPKEYRVAWSLIDLTDPRHPVVRVPKRDLRAVRHDS